MTINRHKQPKRQQTAPQDDLLIGASESVEGSRVKLVKA